VVVYAPFFAPLHPVPPPPQMPGPPTPCCWDPRPQDGGDPDVAVSPRDIVYTLPADQAAAGGQPQVLAQTDLRCGGVAW
jgi:hypothetical protein